MSSDNDISRPSVEGFAHINRYWDKQNEIIAAKILPGEYYVTRENELISTVLGSCVSACIRDRDLRIGGMNHFMLPETSADKLKQGNEAIVGNANRYGNYAMEHLINTILSNGGKRKNLEIKVFGGGKIIPTLTDVGIKNIEFVLNYIDAEGLKLISQDLGDVYPRKIAFFPASGKVRMKKIRALHNETIIQRERRYFDTIKNAPVEGDVELF
ncbi:putative chemoreceptor glutamine deamidase CheD [Candidatus Methylobacter favarea]|uniref:Probable chemoreceptor glutamine deamidase CheD n=1 Tax=Candidatus Methylobacter favarea TaxID=2707345 RepID=A0A8S0YAU4_9GAMM|nr:chemoreceptor glutamine deamidase CheD [Candidatus Methylobacter favarea]CAA9892587.1 putative chemoreceptor glutamine deamidase CheD [Candidatus Methylobacter favarea]